MKTEKSSKTSKKHKHTFTDYCILVIIVCAFLTIFVTCTTLCTSNNDDDSWGYLQKQIDTDPYYKQW